MQIKIKGKEKLLQQLSNIPKAASQGVYNATYELTELIEGNAKSNAQSNAQHPTGELTGGIQSDVNTDDGLITGWVASTKEQGVYVEFGTGPNGQASPKDLPEGVDPVYRQTPWFIHVSQTDRDLNALYGIPIIEIKGEQFYFTHGQPARPFMWPAYKDGMELADEVFKEHIDKAIEQVVK